MFTMITSLPNLIVLAETETEIKTETYNRVKTKEQREKEKDLTCKIYWECLASQ